MVTLYDSSDPGDENDFQTTGDIEYEVVDITEENDIVVGGDADGFDPVARPVVKVSEGVRDTESR